MALKHDGLTTPNGRKAETPFLYHRVADALRSRVTDGALEGGGKLPALREMAGEFGVSEMTVRRALDALEREGYVERHAGVGIFARARRGTDQGTFTFVSSFLNSPFQMGIASGTQRAGQKLDRPVSFLDGHFDAEMEMRNVSRLPRSGSAGAVVLPPFRDPRTVKALQELHRAGYPMVVVDMTLPGVHADFVTSDHEAGAHIATGHLLSRGHSAVFFVTHPPVASSVLSRIQGYERALRDSGKEPVQEWKVWIDVAEQADGFDRDRRWWGGYKAILPVLRGRQGPLAVLAIDAYVGWGVYEACHELGLRIPEDVSVVAFDETEVAHAVRPPMTVIRQPLDELGRVAIELLTRRIETGRTEEGRRKTFTQVVLDVDLIERGSVAGHGEDPAGGGGTRCIA